MPNAEYPPRTHANVRDSSATLLFGDLTSLGKRATVRACAELGRPYFYVEADQTTPRDVADWIAANNDDVLNAAGNRESTWPGSGLASSRPSSAALRSPR